MATITVGSSDYPAFADVAFADEYLGGDIQRATPWALRNVDLKGRGLVSATRQLLRLPWITTPDPQDADLPAVIKEATSMLASDLVAKPKLFSSASQNSNIKLAKAGPAQVEFFSPVTDGPPLPTDIWDMLVAAGLMGSALDDGSNAGAFVTGASDGCRPLSGRWGDDAFLEYAARDFD